MTEPLRVFVNGTGVSVPPGSTVLDAVAAADPAAAAEAHASSRIAAGFPSPATHRSPAAS
jgi:hypothetical protein